MNAKPKHRFVKLSKKSICNQVVIKEVGNLRRVETDGANEMAMIVHAMVVLLGISL